ncbi:UTP--glucose-1-phosphate uridylyltransferase GalU [Phorcysia thermohydrogeniphila]|uniref:UTP--glucose-1-phosphate uridylyltransferase n=1 Tax=Phorcysia thermohydrogeniphila TaxID=936138 RepID=A0A4R1GC00_9BACT|nr:UTP--glucose-1-phosphate uridylyltransferase GalU [Phorcysia thermohydrogeniphila]TCK04035.1 UTP--glucose-1-phosphate uridylyltransferase [Phorcysia thermohydrogeniphila]
MVIRKAVIPVAGLGTRFLPATKAQPKEMLPIVDKPVIQYIVEEAVAAGIKQIIFVTGRHKRAIEDHFDRNLELERALEEKGKEELLKLVREISELVDIVYVRQKEPLGLGHAILTAEPAVGNEPFAVLLGDDIMVSDPPAIKQLIDVFNKYRCCVLGIQEVSREEVSKYGIVAGKEIEEGIYKVDTLIEKPSPEEAPSNLAITGRYILTPGIFEALRNIPPGKGGEIQLTDGIQKLGLREAIYAKIMKGKRYDTGTKVGFLEATVDFALSRKELREPFLRFLKKRLKEEFENGRNDESDS